MIIMISLENFVQLPNGQIESIYEAYYCSDCNLLMHKDDTMIDKSSAHIFYCPQCQYEPSLTSIAYASSNAAMPVSMKCPRSCFRCLCGAHVMPTVQDAVSGSQIQCPACNLEFDATLKESATGLTNTIMNEYANSTQWVKTCKSIAEQLKEINNSSMIQKADDSDHKVEVERLVNWFKMQSMSVEEVTRQLDKVNYDQYDLFSSISSGKSYFDQELLKSETDDPLDQPLSSQVSPSQMLQYCTIGDKHHQLYPQPAQLKVRLSRRCCQCEKLVLKPNSMMQVRANKSQQQSSLYSIRSTVSEYYPFVQLNPGFYLLSKSGEQLIDVSGYWTNNSTYTFQIGIDDEHDPELSQLLQCAEVVQFNTTQLTVEPTLDVDVEELVKLQCKVKVTCIASDLQTHWIPLKCVMRRDDLGEQEFHLYVPFLVKVQLETSL
ncbi:hypothetical protein MIR68_000445 [Amoeboaphelidium protococcarum]|nr:hypothetical protein MIR68_000445 [Amoeboaphelidium protococcarum]